MEVLIAVVFICVKLNNKLYLAGAILFEVAGTTMLKLSAGFTKLLPSILLIIFFGLSFTLLVLALKTLSLSLAYSVWAGLGTAGAGLAGVLFFKEALSGVNILGLIVIIAGVVVMNLAKKPEDEVVQDV